MIENREDFYQNALPLVSTVVEFLGKSDLQGTVKVDHFCYKCSSAEEYERLRSLLEWESEFVYQSFISERRISVMKLKESIPTRFGELIYLELSDQKPDNSQKSGFDHIEVYPLQGPLGILLQDLKKQGIETKKVVRPHHTTYDIVLERGFLLRFEEEPLVEKIKREEMK